MVQRAVSQYFFVVRAEKGALQPSLSAPQSGAVLPEYALSSTLVLLLVLLALFFLGFRAGGVFLLAADEMAGSQPVAFVSSPQFGEWLGEAGGFTGASGSTVGGSSTMGSQGGGGSLSNGGDTFGTATNTPGGSDTERGHE